MNVDNVLVRIREKKQTSSTLAAMEQWVDEVMKYPLVWIPVKDGDKKTSDAIDRICQPLYKYHTVFRSLAHDFMGSVVLIGNSNAVTSMINEFAAFCVALDEFYKQIPKANGRPETVLYYKKFTTKAKDFEPLFIEDMKQYGETYGFDVDVKELMNAVKSAKTVIISNKK